MDPASTSRSHDGSRCLGGRGYERRQRASQSFLAQTCLRRVAVPAVTTTSRDGDNHHMGGVLWTLPKKGPWGRCLAVHTSERSQPEGVA